MEDYLVEIEHDCIAELSGSWEVTSELCVEGMELIEKLLPPEDYGENAEVSVLYDIFRVILYRAIESSHTAAAQNREG